MSFGFSSRVEPWAHATCWSSAERREAGAYPAAFWFAEGTWDTCGASGGSAHTRAERPMQPVAATAVAAPSAPVLSLAESTVIHLGTNTGTVPVRPAGTLGSDVGAHVTGR